MKDLKLTNEEIISVFKLNGCSISEYNEPGEREHGMIFTLNRAKDVNLFTSFQMAYDHFIESNWIR